LFGPERLSKIILVDQSPFLTSDPHWTQQELVDSGAIFTAQQVFDTVAALRSKEAEQMTRWLIDRMVTEHATSELKEWIAQCNLKMPRDLAAAERQFLENIKADCAVDQPASCAKGKARSRGGPFQLMHVVRSQPRSNH